LNNEVGRSFWETTSRERILLTLVGVLIVALTVIGISSIDSKQHSLVVVPNVVGMKQSRAKEILAQDGFMVAVVREGRAIPPPPTAGTVISQSPLPGRASPIDETVTLVVYL
jgi:beta-lactam-binding protein with PASTA domain